jgi:hypothetical protein
VPNRIIKESICTSDTIDQLSWFEEVFFYRLIVNCDDFGRYDGRTAILKSRLFPLKSISDRQIEEALCKLSAVGLVSIYTVNSKPYIQIKTWSTHQTIRNKQSKFPSLDEADTESESSCNQLKSIASKCPRNPIQSNPIRIQSESESCMHGAETAPCPPVAEMPLNDSSLFPIHQEDIDKWKELYPAVDVMQEIRKMIGWLDANPTKRKTKNGIKRFINGWLAKEQDKGKGGAIIASPTGFKPSRQG